MTSVVCPDAAPAPGSLSILAAASVPFSLSLAAGVPFLSLAAGVPLLSLAAGVPFLPSPASCASLLLPAGGASLPLPAGGASLPLPAGGASLLVAAGGASLPLPAGAPFLPLAAGCVGRCRLRASYNCRGGTDTVGEDTGDVCMDVGVVTASEEHVVIGVVVMEAVGVDVVHAGVSGDATGREVDDEYEGDTVEAVEEDEAGDGRVAAVEPVDSDEEEAEDVDNRSTITQQYF
ncbi:hypothetical protein NDU88_003230 [Pleurodeles waltl]|uniref:Uncharacterized protein n=1 Tax=Pleurodeles waltl TaxID=8319 RepID=A0AAV7VFH5_PLEWA|nr:hypothetical protein NDU88_003230 [Pleurodeles waltl]